MAVLEIRKFGDPVLREKTFPIEKIDQEVKKLAKNLIDTLHNAPGMGLAAPQIGILKRVIVSDLGDGPSVYINPQIIWRSKETEVQEEGCLSLPGVRILISRPQKIKVKALSPQGKGLELSMEGLQARIIQHEVDHLDGILILDRASKSERQKALQQISQYIRIQ
ncbi:MAG: peptide deformylase [Actinomycetota bacterium]|nr:peptide deformylase [Actinomycetota bacterium]